MMSNKPKTILERDQQFQEINNILEFKKKQLSSLNPSNDQNNEVKHCFQVLLKFIEEGPMNNTEKERLSQLIEKELGRLDFQKRNSLSSV